MVNHDVRDGRYTGVPQRFIQKFQPVSGAIPRVQVIHTLGEIALGRDAVRRGGEPHRCYPERTHQLKLGPNLLVPTPVSFSFQELERNRAPVEPLEHDGVVVLGEYIGVRVCRLTYGIDTGGGQGTAIRERTGGRVIFSITKKVFSGIVPGHIRLL